MAHMLRALMNCGFYSFEQCRATVSGVGGFCKANTSAYAAAKEPRQRFAQTHVSVIAWSPTGDPDLGDWGPPEILVRTGVIPAEFETGGGVE